MLHNAMFKLFACLSENKIEFDDKKCGNQREQLEKSKKDLLKAIENNKELKKLFDDLNDALDKFHSAIVTQYYKEGFNFGAQLALEICGYEYNEDKSK